MSTKITACGEHFKSDELLKFRIQFEHNLIVRSPLLVSLQLKSKSDMYIYYVII